MKILFIDNKSIQNSIRLGLLEQMAHHDVHLIDSYEDAIEFYISEKPEMVLIDFTVGFGHEALEKILKLNPIQHMITISDSFDCSEILGCDFCLEHYKKKRVLKKDGIHELLYLIENFPEMPCEFAHKLDACISTKDTLTLEEDSFHEEL